jgi:hypothetical protein
MEGEWEMTKHLTPTIGLVAAAMVSAITIGPAHAQSGQAPTEAPATSAPSQPEEDADPIRIRFGGSFDFDVLVATTGTVGLGAGLTLRAGVQFNHLFALYYQPHGIAAGWVTAGGEGAALALFNVAMLELTLPFVQIGVGPSWDVAHVEACNSTLTRCANGDGSAFGLDMRVALVLGGVGRGRRGGFSINLNVHPTFIQGDEVIVTTSIGFGGEMF